MKKIIFLLLLSYNCSAQKIDTSSYYAGKELITFKNKFYTGTTFELIGVGFGVGGILSKNSDFAIIGGVFALGGWIIEITSFKHIGNAGIQLKGNGIGIPLPRKKHSKLYEMNNR